MYADCCDGEYLWTREIGRCYWWKMAFTQRFLFRFQNPSRDKRLFTLEDEGEGNILEMGILG